MRKSKLNLLGIVLASLMVPALYSIAPAQTLRGAQYISGKLTVEKTAVLKGGFTALATGKITRPGQTYIFTDMKIAGASGTDFVLTDNASKATLAASQTSETLIIKITGLHVGDKITKHWLVGQVESAGGAVVLDADLIRVTAVAGDLTETTVASIVRPTVAADTKLSNAATKGTSAAYSETVTADTTYYIRVTGTTAASTDIALMGAGLLIEQN